MISELTKGHLAFLTQHLSKDKDQNHADEHLRLLSNASIACISCDSDGKAGCKTAKAYREP